MSLDSTLEATSNARFVNEKKGAMTQYRVRMIHMLALSFSVAEKQAMGADASRICELSKGIRS
jgi:hypothetical protein